MDINNLLRHISDLVGSNPHEALRTINSNEVQLNQYLGGRMNKNGFLIDIGTALKDEEILIRGLVGMAELIELLGKEPIETKVSLFPFAIYNLANGFSTLSTYERQEAGGILSPDSDSYQNAKKYYEIGLGHAPLLGNEQNARLHINYANILSSMGRSLEAVEKFEVAIKLNDNNPIGLGNLGGELAHHYLISGDRHLLNEARDLLVAALEKKDELIAIGGMHVEAHYRHQLDWVTKRISPDNQKNKRSPFKYVRQKWKDLWIKKPDRNFLKMCKDHGLFLNFSVKGRGDYFIGDTIFPYTLTTGIKDDKTIERLLRTVNEIKERYAVARMSLFEALHPQFDLAAYEDLTFYADTLDYAAYGLRVAKVKLAFENAFNVLDKIAFFLDHSLGLGMNPDTISFSSIWTEKIDDKKQLKKVIHDRNNAKLMALYDLSLDLSHKGFLADVRKIRNISTHRYLIPHVESFNFGEEIDGKDYHLMYEDLTCKAIESLQLARAAVIYMIAFINEEESKKRKDTEKYAPVIYPPYQHLDFNPLNPWRF